MKTIKLTTHWTAEEADNVYQLLDGLKTAIWQAYGEEIAAMYQDRQQGPENKDVEAFNDELPF